MTVAAYMRFDELVSVIGETAALKLVAARGGTQFYVSAEITAESPIAKEIGVEAASQLAQHITTGIGGLTVEIPRGPSGRMAEYRRKLLELAGSSGMSESDIARSMQIHGRTVRRARRKLRDLADSDQGRLF